MNVIIKPSTARGEIYPPSSKSMAHRLLICAALAGGKSVISRVTFSEDILATIDCLRQMGTKITIDGDCVTVYGITDFNFSSGEYFCRESGSTLRFLVPLLLLSENEQILHGKGRLMERPLDVYKELCEESGLLFKQEETLKIRGRLQPKEYNIPGGISSQFITGLLFALSVMKEPSRINIVPPFESASYVNMTLSAMSEFGCDFETEDLSIIFNGKSQYNSREIAVEGDFSGSAFLDAFNLIGGSVKCLGMNDDSLQGDKIYRQYFKLLDYGSPNLDVSDCPDLAPVLMSVAALKNGCKLLGTKRLKIKESDRGTAMQTELSKFGADIEIYENEIIVHKAKLHSPIAVLEGHNDHRIVMALSVIASVYGGEITDAQSVSKSFPSYFDVIGNLGIDVTLKE